MSRRPLSWWSAAELLIGDDEPIVLQHPTRPSSLKGRAIPARDARTDRVTAGHEDDTQEETP